MNKCTERNPAMFPGNHEIMIKTNYQPNMFKNILVSQKRNDEHGLALLNSRLRDLISTNAL